MRSCNRLHRKHSDTPVPLSPNYRFLAGACSLGSASVSFWIHPHKTLPLATSVNSTAAAISPWRLGYLSKLCSCACLVPTPDKRTCEASAFLPSASSFPCACAQGDERSLRRVTTLQTSEIAKDGKRSSLHQLFLGRAGHLLSNLRTNRPPRQLICHHSAPTNKTVRRRVHGQQRPLRDAIGDQQTPNTLLCLYYARNTMQNHK